MWVHVLSAVGWIGGAFYELFVVLPMINAVPIGVKKDVFIGVFRRIPVYYIIFGTATIVSGPLLFIEMGGSLDFSHFWNLLIVSGGLLGLTAWIMARIADFVLAPKMMRQVEQGSFPRMRQLMVGGALGVVLVFVALTLMVAAALL